MMIRLTPHFYLFTPLGVAEAHFVWSSETFEVAVSYGCFQCETKENWWWPNTQVRLCESITTERSDGHSAFHLPDDLLETLRPHILRHTKSPLYGWASSRPQSGVNP